MDIYLAVILGIIQGVIEWLPISSEGIISLILINLFDTSLKEAVYLAIWLHTGTLVAAIVPERMLRYVVAIFINGNQQLKQGVEISTLNEGGTAGTLAQHTVKFSHINVAPADNVQLPDGDYNVEDPLFTMEGGTRGPYGRVLQAGHSVNLTVVYWDSDI